MKNKTMKKIALGLVLIAGAVNTNASERYVPKFLAGTVFETASQESGIDVLLLYAIAMSESNRSRGHGQTGPYALAIRACGRAHYPATRAEAEKTLQTILDSDCTNIDVGIMQISLRWNGKRTDSPFALLDASENVRVGSQVLLDAMQSSPHDVRTAISRYHSWTPELGLPYADSVLALYAALKRNTR